MVANVAPPGQDAMIAASAISNGLPQYTSNPSDFSSIGGFQVVGVPHPDDDGG